MCMFTVEMLVKPRARVTVMVSYVQTIPVTVAMPVAVAQRSVAAHASVARRVLAVVAGFL